MLNNKITVEVKLVSKSIFKLCTSSQLCILNGLIQEKIVILLESKVSIVHLFNYSY